MLKFGTTSYNPLQIEIELRRPLVYLDTCVISDFARNETGGEFRRILLSDGDLYFSWGHLVELFSLGDSQKFDDIVTYLKSFGPHFTLIDSDIQKVSERDAEWVRGRQNPCIDEEFIKQIPGMWDGRTEMSLGIPFDFMRNESGFFEGIREIHTDYKDHQKRFFDTNREKYRTEPEFKKQFDAADYIRIPEHCLGTRIQLELLRELVRTNERFTSSDAFDLSHAGVSVAYCDFTVLDKKWARRCRSLNLPNQAARVFDVTEIDEFVTELKNWKANNENIGSAKRVSH